MKLINFIWAVIFGSIIGVMCSFNLVSGIGAGVTGLSLLMIDLYENIKKVIK